jgi:hypothetical protein
LIVWDCVALRNAMYSAFGESVAGIAGWVILVCPFGGLRLKIIGSCRSACGVGHGRG